MAILCQCRSKPLVYVVLPHSPSCKTYHHTAVNDELFRYFTSHRKRAHSRGAPSYHYPPGRCASRMSPGVARRGLISLHSSHSQVMLLFLSMVNTREAQHS